MANRGIVSSMVEGRRDHQSSQPTKRIMSHFLSPGPNAYPCPYQLQSAESIGRLLSTTPRVPHKGGTEDGIKANESSLYKRNEFRLLALTQG